eukprot:579382-Rhodomonas_salina.1
MNKQTQAARSTRKHATSNKQQARSTKLEERSGKVGERGSVGPGEHAFDPLEALVHRVVVLRALLVCLLLARQSTRHRAHVRSRDRATSPALS